MVFYNRCGQFGENVVAGTAGGCAVYEDSALNSNDVQWVWISIDIAAPRW